VLGTKINNKPAIKLATARLFFLRVINRTTLIKRINSPISASRDEIPSMFGLRMFYLLGLAFVMLRWLKDMTDFFGESVQTI
jgi:hypothetical protein